MNLDLDGKKLTKCISVDLDLEKICLYKRFNKYQNWNWNKSVQRATLFVQEKVYLVNILKNKKIVIHFDFTMMTNPRRSQGPALGNIFVEKS